jgi:peptidoglycan/LPS O-acetylase OafA/YrhL
VLIKFISTETLGFALPVHLLFDPSAIALGCFAGLGYSSQIISRKNIILILCCLLGLGLYSTNLKATMEVATALLIMVLQGKKTFIHKLFEFYPIVWIRLLSYSIYIWHGINLPIILNLFGDNQWIYLSIFFPTLLVVNFISFFFFEIHSRKWILRKFLK